MPDLLCRRVVSAFQNQLYYPWGMCTVPPPDGEMITADSERNLEGFSPSPLFSVGLMGKMGWGRKKPSILEKRWTEDENRIIAWDRDLRHGGRICLSHVIWMGWHRYLACRVARFQSWFDRIFFSHWKMNSRRFRLSSRQWPFHHKYRAKPSLPGCFGERIVTGFP